MLHLGQVQDFMIAFFELHEVSVPSSLQNASPTLWGVSLPPSLVSPVNLPEENSIRSSRLLIGILNSIGFSIAFWGEALVSSYQLDLILLNVKMRDFQEHKEYLGIHLQQAAEEKFCIPTVPTTWTCALTIWFYRHCFILLQN